VTNGTVNALVSNGTNIFMGGDFTSAGPTGNLQTRNRYAVFTPSGTLQNANPSFNNSINSLLISGSYLYIGGAFNDVNNGTTLNGLARINHSNWGLDTSFNAALNSGAVVKSLAVVGSVLYMGGSIASINGNSQTNLAAVNLSTGLNTSFAPSLSAGGTINQLIPKTGSNYIYVSGNFSLIGGQTRTHLALLDTATTYGDAVGGFAPTIDSEVKGIAFTNNGLYAVGNFTTINSNPRKGFANLDVINGSLFSTEEGHTELKTLLEDTDQMFLGGGFGEVKGQYRSGLSVLGK
jgi:hypothetical protein